MIKVVTERNRAFSFQMSYAQRWRCNMSGADVWIDCPTCDLSIGARDTVTGYITDKEFVKVVRDKGWAFIPGKYIACPECRKKKK